MKNPNFPYTLKQRNEIIDRENESVLLKVIIIVGLLANIVVFELRYV